MIWFRVDNRLVHGQVIEAWLPYLDAEALVVVHDALAQEPLQQEIMQLAIPGRIQVVFASVPDAARYIQQPDTKTRGNTLVLTASCRDAFRLAEEGVSIPILNIGNLHYAEGKRQVCPHAALSDDDVVCLKTLQKSGTKLDFRSVPGNAPPVEEW